MIAYNKNLDRIENLPLFMMNASKEQRLACGLYPVEYRALPDVRYYSYTETRYFDNDQSTYIIDYTPVQRDLSAIKEDFIKEIKKIQSTKLSEIDWYWFREQKIGIVVPDSIQTYATQIYTISSSKESEVIEKTFEQLIEYRKTPFQENIIDNITNEEKTVTTYRDMVYYGWPEIPIV